MKEIFSLTKILIKSSSNDAGTKKNKKINGLGKFIILFLVYGYLIGFMSYISYMTINGLILINQPALFLNLIFGLLLGFGTIQTAITSLNVLFFSKDLDFLMPLPITSQKVVMAKLNCLVISQYMIAMFLGMPGLVIYGILLNLGINYYILSCVIVLIFPLIPVAVISLLVTLIMKFTKIIKNKEAVQYITIVLTIFLIVALTGTSENSVTSEEIANSLLKYNGTIEMVIKTYPLLGIVINSLLNYNTINGVTSIAFFMILSLAVYNIVSFMISKIYVKTVISLETVKNKKVKKIENFEKIKMDNIFMSYLKKEFRLLIRNPIFFMQCVLPSIFFPIIITVPAIMELNNTTPDMSVLQNDFSKIINTNYGFMGCIFAMLVLYAFNYASITSISRDGQNAVFMKYIPISLEKQIMYKITPGIILNIIPILYFLIFMIICIPGVKFLTIFYIILISMLINILNNILMILVDLKNPKLKWITEQAVVKQNFNMFFAMAFIGVEAVIVFLIGTFVSDLNSVVLVFFVTFLLPTLLIKKYIKNNQEKIFEKII